LAAVLAGCLPVGSECLDDFDCGGNLACTRNGECVPENSLVFTQIFWTYNGVAPRPDDPTTCGNVADLTVTFRDIDISDDLSFHPVTCNLGRITYDRMPPRFDEVSLIAHDSGGRRLDSATRPLQSAENIIMIDLQP
jgi:hypothetical protein